VPTFHLIDSFGLLFISSALRLLGACETRALRSDWLGFYSLNDRLTKRRRRHCKSNTRLLGRTRDRQTQTIGIGISSQDGLPNIQIVENVRQTFNVRGTTNGTTSQTTDAGVGIIHDYVLGYGLNLGGNVGDSIDNLDLMGLLRTGFHLSLNLLRLLSSTTDEGRKEIADTTGLLNLGSEV